MRAHGLRNNELLHGAQTRREERFFLKLTKNADARAICLRKLVFLFHIAIRNDHCTCLE